MSTHTSKQTNKQTRWLTLVFCFKHSPGTLNIHLDNITGSRWLWQSVNHSPDAQHVFTQLAQAYEVLSNRERRTIYDQSSEMEKKQDFAGDTQHGSYGDSDFLAFGLHELVNMLRMEDDFTMWEDLDVGLGQRWSFNMWDEGQDDDGDHLGDMFSVL
ncbi:hypothetical protein AMELA_G00185870 [Ameiurus melas]|uniref:J domain-containing protein n=1 Tax=Ameiurus melas TaxID=219545 RepID=A0A7J6A7L3_AMEME|nr:hypothetical protein AMELA_G00185870 [Ameiurus melas]